MHEIIDEFYKSPRYNDLSERAKIQYDYVTKKFGGYIIYNGKPFVDYRADHVDNSVVDYLRMVLEHEYARATIRQVFSVFSSIWQVAKRSGRVWDNPFRDFPIKLNNQRDLTYSRDEVYRCIKASKERGFLVLARYILFCYFTGARPWSDLRELKWSNVITVDGVTVFSFRIKKNSTDIMIPLPKELRDELDIIKSTTNSEYIFVDADNSRPAQQRMQREFEIIKEETGINSKLQMRDLRRTMVTELVMGGASDQEVTALTGWKSPASVINRYARIRLTTAKNAMNKLEAMRNENI